MMGAITGQKTLFDGAVKEDIVSVSAPSIEPVTTTIRTLGGEIEYPTSLYGAIEIAIGFNGISKDTAPFYVPGKHTLEHRYIQEVIRADGEKVEQLVKVYAGILGKAISPGTPEMGAVQENELTVEGFSYRMLVDGEEIIHINKLTGKVVVNKKDLSAKRTKLLG